MRMAVIALCWCLPILIAGSVLAIDLPTGPWLTGNIRDDHGAPVADAFVFVTSVSYDGHGLSRWLASGKTASDGKYTAIGYVGPLGGIGKLFVCKPGLVSATGSFNVPERPHSNPEDGWADAAPSPVPIQNITMTSTGGGLDVIALVNGRPAANVPVVLQRAEFERLAHGLNWQIDPKITGEFDHAIHPSAQTDAKGIAHFRSLTPGRWDITAGVDFDVLWGKRTGTNMPNPPGDSSKKAFAVGVSVRAGLLTTQVMNLYEQRNTAATRTLGVGAKPLADLGNMPANSAFAADDWLGTRVDENGNRTIAFHTPGIHRIELQASAEAWDFVRPEYRLQPYQASVEDVAVSSLLHPKVPQTFSVRTVNPATVEVKLETLKWDVQHDPMTIEVAGSSGFHQTAILRADGHATFDSISPGEWTVFARPSIKAEDRFDWTDKTLPSDADLTGKTFMLPAHLTAAADEHIDVSIRSVPAGYLRGRIKPQAGCTVQDYAVFPKGDSAGPQRVDYNDKTGEFIAGPFEAGIAELCIDRRGYGLYYRPILIVRPLVQAGNVVRIADISPPPIDKDQKLRRVLDEDRVQIFLADGKTPASFARATVLPAGSEKPWVDLLADFDGNLNLEQDDEIHFPNQGATDQFLLASLPGTVGATIFNLVHRTSGPLSIVLPEPIAASGRVTIGGKSTAGLNAQLRVLAAYQGKGQLNKILGVWATPQDDGTFELKGLTPGHYLVQAAVDGIWLSHSVEMNVDDHDVTDVTLDVGTPSGTLSVIVVDPAGKPAVGQLVTIDRPAGPLTDLDWPADFRTDSAGVANLPPMEVGKHVIHIGRQAVEIVLSQSPDEPPKQMTYIKND